MDVLIIRPNDANAVYGSAVKNVACEPPFWALIIASYLRQNKNTVEIYDAEALHISPQEVGKKAGLTNAKLILIMVTGTNLSASTWKMNGAKECIDEIKKSCNIPIMIWGLHPSALPEKTMNELNVEYLMKGEGLESINTLLQHFNEKKMYDIIEGLYYKDENGQVKGNDKIQLISAEKFPDPAYDMVDMTRYKAHNWQRFGESKEDEKKSYAVIATSLGCPFQCSFCAISALFGKKTVRYLSPERVVKNIEDVVNKYNVKYIKFLDENFVLNMEHVEKICDLLIEKNLDINIWAYARIDTLKEEILEKLYKAGIRWLAYGIESASEISLKDVSKGQYGVEEIKNVIEMTKKANISSIANFMFGLPEDTLESMEQTLQFAREVNPEFINFYCTMAYPGSEVYKECLKNHQNLSKDWLSYSQFSYECVPLATKNLTSEEILRFRDYAYNEFFQDNTNYFNMIQKKFGEETVLDLHQMLSKKMRRKILE